MVMTAEQYVWNQIEAVHYKDTSSALRKSLGYIELYLRDGDIIFLELSEYSSLDFQNYRGKYEPEIAYKLKEICKQNKTSFKLT